MTSANLPFVSVIMPVRNEADFIRESLGAVLTQTYPKALMEVIVADGMSSDNTRELISAAAAESGIAVTIVDNPERIAPSGLNRAIENSRGEIVVRVDGHCEIDPEYVANCVELLQSGVADGVGGPIETIGEGSVASAIAIAMSSKFGVGGSAFRTVDDREMYADTVAFPAYTRRILEKAGPFNEELVRNQDDEYNYRIRKLGGRILLSPKIRSRYYSRSSFRSLWRQYFQYGYWKVRVFQLHPRQMSLRQFVPFSFVTAILGLSVLSLFLSIGLWVLAGLLSVYAAASIAASCMVAGREIKQVPYLTLSFWILHVSYGLGSLIGLVAFVSRWEKSPGILQKVGQSDAPAHVKEVNS